MVKLMASIIVIFGCGAYGLIMARRYLLRPKQLKAFHQAFTALDTEISYCATPLPQALRSAASGVLSEVAAFFATVADGIDAGTSAGSMWEETCQKFADNLVLTLEDWQVIRSLGVGLGSTDRVEETKKLKLACHRLLAAEERAVEQGAKLAKMWSYMGFLTGAAIALVLL